MSKPSIHITGMGCVCAAGGNVPESMANLYSGQRHPQPPINIQAQLETPYPVFEVVAALNSEFGIRNSENEYGYQIRTTPHASRPTPYATRTTQLTLHALNEASQQAQLSAGDLRKKRIGVAIGTTVGCTLNNEPFYREFRAGRHPEMTAIKRYLQNNPAQYISDLFELTGPVASIANACSSGADAIGLAKSWLENDWCDLAIAGGSDELSRITYLGFISLLVTSPEPCKPFDKNRTGLNLGEGAGIVILEKLMRNAEGEMRNLAEVAGYGAYADAYHPTAPHPEGTGLRKAIQYALMQADIQPGQIGFVNAHGTSTNSNDKVEGAVIADIFSKNIPVVSTKAYTGHTLGAAGAIEAVFTIQALLDQKLPATAGFSEFDAECALSPTTRITELNTEYGISNSLAFGGNNSTLILRRAQ